MRDSALPILDVQAVSKTFSAGAGEIQALSNASLSIAKGEFICLIGASGCGKSTLLRISRRFRASYRRQRQDVGSAHP